jgi:hypothetical protein
MASTMVRIGSRLGLSLFIEIRRVVTGGSNGQALGKLAGSASTHMNDNWVQIFEKQRDSIVRRVRADYALRIAMTKRKPKDQLQKRGRKSDFRPEYILIAKACARFGAIEDEIANELHIGPATLDRWKQKYPEFRCALKAGKEASDDRVERSLYQLAIGWNGQPPNATACIFWLKNRRKDRWRDVQNVEADIGHYILSDRPMSEEEWIMQRTVMEQKRAPKQIDSQVLAEDEQKPQD